MNAAAESRSATSRGHRNAPLTPEGRLRLCLRVDAGRPIAHLAGQAGISHRQPQRHERGHRRSGRGAAAPDQYGPARLAAELERLHGITVAPATVHRVLVRRGLSRLRDLDPPADEHLREGVPYEHARVGDLVHVGVKKLGRIPAGGGWRMHNRGTEAARASKGTGPGTGKAGYTYLHTAIDDFCVKFSVLKSLALRARR